MQMKLNSISNLSDTFGFKACTCERLLHLFTCRQASGIAYMYFENMNVHFLSHTGTILQVLRQNVSYFYINILFVF